jgi:TolA-binding protein
MKYIMAVLMLLILMVGCAPSSNSATSQPITPVPEVNKSSQVQPMNNDSVTQARIRSLETELANFQSTNIKLQKQIDQLASANNTPPVKEPVSGDSGVYYMKSDQPGLQYPNKYLVWDILAMECTPFKQCKLNSRLINNHPALAMTNVTVNAESIGSAGTSANIKPGETFTNTKNLPMPMVVDYQVVLRWVWQ